MKKFANLTVGETIDLSTALVTTNAPAMPLTSLILGNDRVVKANGPEVQKRIKTLSRTNSSGARKEGANAPDAETTTYDVVKNYCEIFSKTAKVSGTAGAVEGNVEEALTREIMDRTLEIKLDMEYAMLNGIKGGENSEGGRTMDGLLSLVDEDNIINAKDKEYNKVLFLSAFQAMYNAGGTFGRLFYLCNPTVKGLTDDIFLNAPSVRIQYAPSLNAALEIVVKAINTDFGVVNMLMSTQMPANTGLAFNLDTVEIHELRKFGFEKLAKVGDYEGGMVTAENTIIAAPTAIAKIVNIGQES